MEKAAELLKKNFSTHLEDLKNLVRIPSVSFAGFPEQEMIRGADAVAELLKKRGLEKVQILSMGKGNPYVYGERMKAPGQPTVLLYAHYDVQPPGRDELWKSGAFEPTLRESPQGMRLFGRGTADDKGGIVMHTSAIAAYLEAGAELPLNVKVLIEGEEEIGSANLEDFLAKHKQLLDADAVIITDTNNFDVGIPALTVSLRGIVSAEIEVRSLDKTVHSGMYGGPVPDPAMALSKMLASLVDSNGRIAVPGIMAGVRAFTKEEAAELRTMPFNEADFRKQVGMVPSAQLLRDGPSTLAQLWRMPSLTINAIQASSRKMASNIINDTAWARVTVRLVPDMDPEKVGKELDFYLKSRAPWGVEVTTKIDSGGAAWAADVKGPAFEAAEAALKKGYGVAPYKIGCGGSIGFVKPFVEALGGAPAILTGVEDPYTNAHGENESVLVEDLKKACVAECWLFSELAARWKK